MDVNNENLIFQLCLVVFCLKLAPSPRVFMPQPDFILAMLPHSRGESWGRKTNGKERPNNTTSNESKSIKKGFRALSLQAADS